MMLRWAGLLVTGVVLVLLSGLFYWWSDRDIAQLMEATRTARVQWQNTEQTINILNKVATDKSLYGFNNPIDIVQIEVAQLLSRIADTDDDVEILSFEQNLLPSTFSSSHGQSIRQLRVALSISASHSVALLNTLDAFESELLPWPMEVRSCDIWRGPATQLSVKCVLDIYHWDIIS